MMKIKNMSFVTGKSVFSRFVVGVAAAALVSALLLTGLTKLVISGIVLEDKTGIFVFAIHLLAALVGGLTGSGSGKEKLLQVIGCITLGYFLMILALGVIVYDGGVHNLASGLVSTLLGGLIVSLIKLKSQMSRGRATRRRR